jgi:hypothetical protein
MMIRSFFPFAPACLRPDDAPSARDRSASPPRCCQWAARRCLRASRSAQRRNRRVLDDAAGKPRPRNRVHARPAEGQLASERPKALPVDDGALTSAPRCTTGGAGRRARHSSGAMRHSTPTSWRRSTVTITWPRVRVNLRLEVRHAGTARRAATRGGIPSGAATCIDDDIISRDQISLAIEASGLRPRRGPATCRWIHRRNEPISGHWRKNESGGPNRFTEAGVGRSPAAARTPAVRAAKNQTSCA